MLEEPTPKKYICRQQLVEDTNHQNGFVGNDLLEAPTSKDVQASTSCRLPPDWDNNPWNMMDHFSLSFKLDPQIQNTAKSTCSLIISMQHLLYFKKCSWVPKHFNDNHDLLPSKNCLYDSASPPFQKKNLTKSPISKLNLALKITHKNIIKINCPTKCTFSLCFLQSTPLRYVLQNVNCWLVIGLTKCTFDNKIKFWHTWLNSKSWPPMVWQNMLPTMLLGPYNTSVFLLLWLVYPAIVIVVPMYPPCCYCCTS